MRIVSDEKSGWGLKGRVVLGLSMMPPDLLNGEELGQLDCFCSPPVVNTVDLQDMWAPCTPAPDY